MSYVPASAKAWRIQFLAGHSSPPLTEVWVIVLKPHSMAPWRFLVEDDAKAEMAKLQAIQPHVTYRVMRDVHADTKPT